MLCSSQVAIHVSTLSGFVQSRSAGSRKAASPTSFLSTFPFQELGVSERLAVLIEGESLLNDGTSIVVFSVFFDAATGAGSTSASFVVTQFVRLGLGGPLVGFLTGMIG